MKTELLRLFNAVLVAEKAKQEIEQDVLERTIKNGYILDPAIQPTNELLNTIEKIVGISGIKANASFHKSWTVVQDSSMETLVMQQILHYLTTYGFEELGMYHEETVYIPNEVLELPTITDDIALTVVKAMDREEVLDAIINLGSGIALSQETLNDIMVIVEANKYTSDFISQIHNRELKGLLVDYYNIVPDEPVEFLRYVVSKLTDESLLIKNDYLIDKIKQANGKFLDTLLKDAPGDLASIFYRFKPLFLAMKSISKNKTFFNRLRKKAIRLHKPLPVDYMNDITAQIKQNRLNLDALKQKLNNATIFRKIRLAYALTHRINAGDSILYKIRNGSGWATDFDWDHALHKNTEEALDVVIASIVDEIKENVEGKTLYIPNYINYTLPATEKQFTGFLPSGSYIAVPEDLIVGIHWTNTDKRIDLDLSVINKTGKIGWDSMYRSDNKSVLFSGDVTDAPEPRGASELFYFKKYIPEPMILMVNFFNFSKGDQVECKIVTAHETPKQFERNYMIDPKNIIASAHITIKKKQNILGLVVNVGGENRVYFSTISIGNSITSAVNTQSTQARGYLINSLINAIGLREILQYAGANIVTEKPEGDYIDLSPTALDKRTIMDLIKPIKIKKQ